MTFWDSLNSFRMCRVCARCRSGDLTPSAMPTNVCQSSSVLLTECAKQKPVQCRQADIINNMNATLSFSLRCISRILDVSASHLCYASTPPPRRPLESQIVGSRRQLVSLISSSSTDTFQNTNMSENQCALRVCAHTQTPKATH